ncbi:aminodeoxychorismate lyase [Cobetia marina]|uniref:aminodeoxychorismate lyase n=1 Tax=Cobetia marina TaxID=28258 RepID=UPI00116DAB26|nr:aminodeoxychorismate lyase [Cobetia marina]GED43722.1 aminodeoxychorismate lyase [Cobetia marina]
MTADHTGTTQEMLHDSLAADLPMEDRGLAYGEGVFETILVRDGQPQLWSRHLARLTRGCRRLGLPVPSSQALDACLNVCRGEGLEVLKLVVTGGSGGRGYKAPESPEPRLRARAMPFVVNREARQGITARVCELRVAEQPALAGLKHLNRLENVLARREWTDPAIREGLLLTASDELVEATSMNLAWYRDGQWFTPCLDRAGVEGTLLVALEAELPVMRVREGLSSLRAAEVVVVMNSVQGVWPLRTLLAASGEPLAQWSAEGHPALASLNDIVARLLGEPAY